MPEHERLAQEAAAISRLQAEAEQGSDAALREVDERRADLNESALESIHAVLDGRDWSPDTPESIATILRAIGLGVRDVSEVDEIEVDAEH